MAAITLAGGSLAGCSGALAPDDSTASDERAPQTDPPLEPPPVVLPRPRMGYTIPPCNANPDPCCRNPELPQCPRDAGHERDAAADAGSDAASCGK